MEAIVKKLEQDVSAVLDNFKSELAAIRTNRPNPALVEDIKVNVYDQDLPIKQLGSISIVPPREIVIALWDASAITQVAKGLETGDHGFNPQVRGNSIHINLPALSQERRDELSKLASSSGEKARIQIRNHRDQSNKTIDQAENAKEITEDQRFSSKKQIQEAINKANKEVEDYINNKVRELSE